MLKHAWNVQNCANATEEKQAMPVANAVNKTIYKEISVF